MSIHARDGACPADRFRAGEMLAWELRRHRADSLVLGIPRGGMAVAGSLADALGAPLNVILAQRLRFHGNPDYALGAVAEPGTVCLNEGLSPQLYMESTYLQREKSCRLAELGQRIRRYRRTLPEPMVRGKTVIVADDFVVTGATMRSVLHVLRQRRPAVLIAAVACGPAETARELASVADEFVCLRSCGSVEGASGCLSAPPGDGEIIDYLRSRCMALGTAG